jgi:hypothetical protein
VVWDGLPTCPSSATQLGPRTQVAFEGATTQPIAKSGGHAQCDRYTLANPAWWIFGAGRAARAHRHLLQLTPCVITAFLLSCHGRVERGCASRRQSVSSTPSASTTVRHQPRLDRGRKRLRAGVHAIAADVHCMRSIASKIYTRHCSIGRRPARPIGVLVARCH